MRSDTPTRDALHLARSFLPTGNIGTSPSIGPSPIDHNSFFAHRFVAEAGPAGDVQRAEAGLTPVHVLITRTSEETPVGRIGIENRIGQFVEPTTSGKQAESGLGKSGNETLLGNQTGTGMTSSGDSQLASQQNMNQGSPSIRPSAFFDERLNAFNTTSPQRLQIDVQLSEATRVQVDVAVQQRQVYASLLVDQNSLRNLALQHVSQLEEQLTQVGMELEEFDAGVAGQS